MRLLSPQVRRIDQGIATGSLRWMEHLRHDDLRQRVTRDREAASEPRTVGAVDCRRIGVDD